MGRSRRSTLRAAAALLAAALLPWPATADEGRYRGFWVDTFNTALSDHQDVMAVVENARGAQANAIFAQVRRRGDAWYLRGLEPPPDGVPIAPGFDPLQDLVTEAHAAGLEVHAFVIVGAVWNRHPVILGPPSSPQHVFNRHGGFDPATGRIEAGPDNWLTRTLLPDGAAGITFQGHRFGSDFWMDPGHPGAAADTVDVLLELVRHYAIDGLHLDRIRYPEIGIAGQTPATGANIGYNVTSVARFQRRHGIAAGSPPPAPGDTLWAQWRRDQVSNLVRRIYLGALAIRPEIRVSAALIAFGAGPVSEGSWPGAEAYWRVYQDWRAWTEEGILDLAIPMNYKSEHLASGPGQYDQWNEWTRNHAYDRATLIGQGSFVNGVEGSLRQVRRALAPSAATGAKTGGILFFSMATSDRSLLPTDTAGHQTNPFAIPPGPTPRRPFGEFASALVTGRSMDGATSYEDPLAFPAPVFQDPVPVPQLPWKTDPARGHLQGLVRDEGGEPVDTGAVQLTRVSPAGPAPAGRVEIETATDGGGYYGGVDLAPGTYQVTVTPVGQAAWAAGCRADVTAGQVARLDLHIDREVPATTAVVDPARLWPPNHRRVPVTVSGTATDGGTGVGSVSVRVLDEYGQWEPVVEPLAAGLTGSFTWSRTFDLVASRRGQDQDGRTYTIEVTVADGACNVARAITTVVVPHDNGH